MKKYYFLLMILFYSCATEKFTVIAHRGASGYLPEHTLEAVALAHGMNPDYIEPDVVLSKDNIPVVLHDIHLDTTTNVKELFPSKKRKDGRWYAIDFTLAQLKKLSVHERINIKTGKKVFAHRFPLKTSRFEIPTLEEYIELVDGLNSSRDMNIGIYPEIKSPNFHLKNGKNIADIVWEVLAKYSYTLGKKKIFFQCFDPVALKYIKNKYKPKIPLIQLVGSNSWRESVADYQKMMTQEGLREVKTYADGIGVWIPLLVSQKDGSIKASDGLMNAKKLGLTVHAYTMRADQLPGFIKDLSELTKILSKNGVDGAFSDFPDKLK